MALSIVTDLLLPVKKLWWRRSEGALTLDDLKWTANSYKRVLTGERCTAALPYDWRGTLKRWDLLQDIIDRNRYTSYLEIGCHNNECFDKIRCEVKIGVDPSKGGTVRKTSDDFFEGNKEKFDCIFIDGLHTYEQVRKDINNSLNALASGGIILLHDCLPISIGYQAVPREQAVWNGDVWKAIVEQRTRGETDTATCAIDQGIGVIIKRENTDTLTTVPHQDFKRLTFHEFAENHWQWMRSRDYDGILQFIDGKEQV